MDKYDALLRTTEILEEYEISLPDHPYDVNTVREKLLDFFEELIDVQHEHRYDVGYDDGFAAGKERAAEAIRDAVDDAVYDL